ncbi:MAG: hypothetical protein Q9191_005933 [Dirinaria sp. TL-2023a]
MDKALNPPRLDIVEGSEPHEFTLPVKKINDGQDVSHFLVSQAYGDIMTFVMQLNRAMFPYFSQDDPDRKSPNIPFFDSTSFSFNQTIVRLRNLLDDLEKIIDEAPPDPGPRRFGNIAFRKWYEIVEKRTPALLEHYLPLEPFPVKSTSNITAHSELGSYLLGSFGSSQRLDYGTGHELSFLAFLGCLWKLDGFPTSTKPGHAEREIVLGVMEPYLQLVRRLIKTYTLEPAGSHGVWGLDDHSFLPYLFGSAQYGPAISNNKPTPTEGSRGDAPDLGDVSNATAVARERGRNLYFGAIGFIYDVKKGPFWEHSPMLYDISGVRGGWAKINKGMLKMYNAEVLSKFPVVQHFRFGSLFRWDRDPAAVAPPSSAHSASQPLRADPSTTITQFPPRGPLPPPQQQQGTKAPWAPADTSNIAEPVPAQQGTKAPWATTTTTTDPSNITHLPARGRLPPEHGTKAPWAIRPDASAAKPQQAKPGAMPPPMTKAPWAKGGPG